MNADEKAIVDYLKTWPSSFVSGREIARKVGGKHRYEEDRGWAVRILAKLVTDGLLEKDHLGYFRIRQEDPKKRKTRKHISPQMLRILKNSGKNFESIVIDDESGGS